MARMVPDPREPLDQLGDPRQGPEVGAESVRPWPIPQRSLHPSQLRGVQPGLPARTTRAFEPRPPLGRPRMEPVVRTDPGYSQRLRHRHLRFATREQPRGLQPTSLRPGLPFRQTHDYRRNGLTSLYAALEVASGRVLGECTRRHTGADFLAFLKRITRRYRGRALHIILDNSSTHTTPAVHAGLAAHPDVHFHFTPKGASWLNLVEAWFSILTRKSVRRASFETVRALVRHIEHYIDEWNSHPTPFVWTKEPADIVKKAVRSVNMTSRTEH